MAVYCAYADVQKRLRDFGVNDLSQTNDIDPAIVRASAFLDAKLAHYYSVPFSVVTARTDIIFTITVELASGYVMETVYQDTSTKLSELAKELVKRAEAWLNQIRQNEMDVPDEARLA